MGDRQCFDRKVWETVRQCFDRFGDRREVVCVLLSHSLFTFRDCVFSCKCFVIACLSFLFSLQFVFLHPVDIDSNSPLSVLFVFASATVEGSL